MHKLLLGIWFTLGLATALAQDSPKIGLVLSGGGAKGLAHIGALKVIEASGVKVDYIGGTSMGAIVGALYSAGYSPEQLEAFFNTMNVSDLIQDEFPRSSKSFYDKRDAERYALSLPFDNFNVNFPEAISGGQNVYHELVRLLYHVKDVQDFNKLPIPFLAIATNVETGEPVVLNSGFLPEAVMASGTFPSLFEPTEINGDILIDGGVVNNYPVQEIRDLGADIIIGVDVQDDLATREGLLSGTEVLFQINNYRTVKDMVGKRKQTDIYIKPNITNFNIVDFEKGRAIIDSGAVAAKKLMGSLQDVANRQSPSDKSTKEIHRPDSLVINRLLIQGNERYTRGYIKGKLRLKLSEKTSFDKLKQGLNNLAATENFKAIRYHLTDNGLGTDLLIKLKEKPNKMFLKMSAHYDDLYKSSALINITRKNWFLNDDVAAFDFIVGDNLRYHLDYYVDKGSYWSFGLNSTFNSFNRQVDFDVIRSNFAVVNDPNIGEINLDVTDLTNKVYLETLLREEFSFRLGAEHKLLRYSTRTINELAPATDANLASANAPPERTFFEDSNYFSAFGRLVFDTYDDNYFPTKGLFFDGNFNVYLFSSDFNDNFREFSVGKARMGAAFEVLPNLSINFETEGGFKLGTSPVTSFDFVLGGFGNAPLLNIIPFFGYDFLSLPGNSYVKSSIRMDYLMAPKSHLMFVANAANVDDDLFRTGEWFTAPTFSGYAIGYGLESFLGPVQVYYSWSPQQEQNNLYFSIGYWF
ncbi:Patatin [Croceitalea dokdonensis DOKDO 023]|uniref:Patatin n=1 Tax=Croceitalea dokdonensis DOKDO 023 TaxID=1300341 RepID=A0A0P7B1J1_9FLAO|nr:patatin-like phospholipase family protein [Croceitalea dokdonensis]KPM32981.1 Patatin [Croceitalea dokdonensis DOKDO 023]